MKKLITLCLFGVLLSIANGEALKVKFVTGEWAPYVSESLPEKGASAELVKAICKEADLIPEFAFYPWARTEKMVKEGEAFAGFPYALNDERKKDFYLSDPMNYGQNCYFYYEPNSAIGKDVKNFTKLEEFKAYKFGVLLGSFVEKDLEKENMQVSKTASMESIIKMLQAKRFDFTIDEKAVLFFEAKRLFPTEAGNFKALDISYGVKMPNGLIVSKTYPKSQEILKRFNDGLAKLKKNGEYDRIITKHHMTK